MIIINDDTSINTHQQAPSGVLLEINKDINAIEMNHYGQSLHNHHGKNNYNYLIYSVLKNFLNQVLKYVH